MSVSSEKRRIVSGPVLPGDTIPYFLRGIENGWGNPQILQPLLGQRSKTESPEH